MTEEKNKIESEHNPVPLWVKVMWLAFAAWGLIYLSLYMLPDFARWVEGGDPDAIQWEAIKNESNGAASPENGK